MVQPFWFDFVDAGKTSILKLIQFDFIALIGQISIQFMIKRVENLVLKTH